MLYNHGRTWVKPHGTASIHVSMYAAGKKYWRGCLRLRRTGLDQRDCQGPWEAWHEAHSLYRVVLGTSRVHLDADTARAEASLSAANGGFTSVFRWVQTTAQVWWCAWSRFMGTSGRGRVRRGRARDRAPPRADTTVYNYFGPIATHSDPLHTRKCLGYDRTVARVQLHRLLPLWRAHKVLAPRDDGAGHMRSRVPAGLGHVGDLLHQVDHFRALRP